MADIDLLFGVSMGGPSGDSASTIKGQLESIIKSIEPLNVLVQADSQGLQGFKDELDKLTSYAKSQAVEIRSAYSTALNGLDVPKDPTGNKKGSGSPATPAKLTAGMIAYDKAIVNVNTKLGEYRKKLAAWSAAATGSTQGDYEKLNTQYGELQTLLSDLKSGSLTAEQFASRFNLIKREASEAANAIDEAGKAFKSGADTKEYYRQLEKVNNLLIKVKKDLQDWSSAKTGSSSSSYRDLERTAQEAEELRNELLNAGHALDTFDNRFDNVSSSAKQFAANIKLAGENTKSIKSVLGNLMSTLGISITFAEVFHKAIEIGREMVQTVTEVDTAMTELKKVTDEADSTYVRFLENARGRAHGLGATVAETVNATADFARLGHGITDASSLADAAIVYKNVGDGINDISTASQSIISTMQAFKIEAKDAMSIVDSFNAVGNNFAVSSQGIGEALLNSAAALSAAGNDIHESIALIAAANTTIQDPGKVGTALKTVSMYLRAAKTEAEEAGLSTDNMASSVSELRNELLALTGQKVDIMKNVDTGEYKSTVEILRDLSTVWDDLSDTSRTNITELIGGGVRNANVIAALMQNFDIVEDALATSQQSAGSALAENEKYLDSVAGKVAQLKSSLESLSTSVLGSDFVKGIVTALDAATRLATVISDVAFDNFFTTLSTLTIGSGAFKLFKDLD